MSSLFFMQSDKPSGLVGFLCQVTKPSCQVGFLCQVISNIDR